MPFMPSVPTAFPLHAAALQSPIHTQSDELPFAGGRRTKVPWCTNTSLSFWMLQFGREVAMAAFCPPLALQNHRRALEGCSSGTEGNRNGASPQHVQQQQKPRGLPAPSPAVGTRRPRGLAGRGCSCRSACPRVLVCGCSGGSRGNSWDAWESQGSAQLTDGLLGKQSLAFQRLMKPDREKCELGPEGKGNLSL